VSQLSAPLAKNTGGRHMRISDKNVTKQESSVTLRL